MRVYNYTALLGLVLLFLNCETSTPSPELAPEIGEEFSAGRGTTMLLTSDAFGQQIDNLTSEEGLLFFVGNSFFKQNWVTAPASTTARDGLGPFFNAQSCSSCHLKDGRGRPPEYKGELSHGLLLRLSVPGSDENGNPLADANYGGQLQDQSISGVMTEGGFEILYTEISGSYPDGQTYSLRKPLYNMFDLSFGELSENILVSPRIAQQMIGLGYFEAIDESTILSNADADDADGDGISGRPNYVWNVKTQSTSLGLFGWKSNQPTIEQQVAGAFLGDIGITSYLFPEENCVQDCDETPNGGSPEIDNDDLAKTVLYTQTLAVPMRRDWDNQDVLKGKNSFIEIGCNKCHIEKFETGTHPSISALSNETIRPYTDLLLHDMGDELADNRPDFLANGNEWRTQPLWGIGLIPTVNNHTFLLHDGRARNIEEAILWHGGEAEEIKDSFKSLDLVDRENIIRFIESL
ncbi:MAG: thiol oxidoreductase [Reichenbachiella sp.]